MKYFDEDKIIDFIDGFRVFGRDVRECFTQANCYWFAYILHTRFPQSIIMINITVSHFACKIDDELYDITGNCSNSYDGEWVSWYEYQTIDPAHSKRIIHYCIDKNYEEVEWQKWN